MYHCKLSVIDLVAHVKFPGQFREGNLCVTWSVSAVFPKHVMSI